MLPTYPRPTNAWHYRIPRSKSSHPSLPILVARRLFSKSRFKTGLCSRTKTIFALNRIKMLSPLFSRTIRALRSRKIRITQSKFKGKSRILCSISSCLPSVIGHWLTDCCLVAKPVVDGAKCRFAAEKRAHHFGVKMLAALF